MGYLYKYENKVLGKQYIGQTTADAKNPVIKRLEQHLIAAYTGQRDNANEVFLMGLGFNGKSLVKVRYDTTQALVNFMDWSFTDQWKWSPSSTTKETNQDDFTDFLEIMLILCEKKYNPTLKVCNVLIGGAGILTFKSKNPLLKTSLEFSQFSNQFKLNQDLKIINPFYYMFVQAFITEWNKYITKADDLWEKFYIKLLTSEENFGSSSAYSQRFIKELRDLIEGKNDKGLKRIIYDIVYKKFKNENLEEEYVPSYEQIEIDIRALANKFLKLFPSLGDIIRKNIQNQVVNINKKVYKSDFKGQTFKHKSQTVSLKTSFVHKLELNRQLLKINLDKPSTEQKMYTPDIVKNFQREIRLHDWNHIPTKRLKELSYGIFLKIFPTPGSGSFLTQGNYREVGWPSPLISKIQDRGYYVHKRRMLHDMITLWHYQNYNWIVATREKTGEVYRVQGVKKENTQAMIKMLNKTHDDKEVYKEFSPNKHGWKTIDDYIHWNANITSTKDLKYW